MPRKRIVLIEDINEVRGSTKEILELADYEVFTSSDGKEGIDLIKSKMPDLILCDILMSDLDGYGVLGILNKIPKTNNIPFIFLTSNVKKSEIRRGMNLGADDYIARPYTESELLEAIEARLNKIEILKKDLCPEFDLSDNIADDTANFKKLLKLTDNRKILSYKKKEFIFREDDYANYIYFIVKGKVKCVKDDFYGHQFVNDIYVKGDFIGYLPLLMDGEYNETAIAMGQVQVAIIPKKDFIDLIRKKHEVTSYLIKFLSRKIKLKEDRLFRMAYSLVVERVADVLLKLHKMETNKEESSGRLLISRDDLASLVGTTKESLIRTLSELKKHKLVDTKGQEIKILNKKGLQKIVTGF